MGTSARVVVLLCGGMLFGLVTTGILSRGLFGGETDQVAQGTSVTPADVGLTVQEGVLSLRAQNTSLKGIFEAIGRQLSIEVDTRVPADEQITLAFDQLTLMEALKRFRPYVSYLVLEDAAKAPGTIRKLIIVSKRAAGVPTPPTPQEGKALAPPEPRQGDASPPAAPARPQPFRFEFDPTAVGERGR